MKIGIMSDSHDHIENITGCIEIFKERNVDYVLHLGDYVNPNSVRACQGIKLVGIFGNNDGDKFRLITAFNDISGEIKGEFYEFEEDGLKFACYHGTEYQLKDALVECGKYNVVIYGHTHECKNEIIGKTLVLNPGTSHGFGDKATIMIFETQTGESEFITL
ncbi:MAG TPA: metallophosphoesterase [Nitrospirae bacterium]|nr:phosphodiesterase [bacterium BMS3Abin06]HDH12038.1 metallophosphoesterase [Nitrospirota bacterium]HDZ00858.1 metallophosphoesterase [Nitrospirota bacterium]